ncbi:hypothetical protein M758_4G067600 [Ceratodon purpureus]|nr:hypothetical protein M758_4G067600 [Ceratodon purpureus]
MSREFCKGVPCFWINFGLWVFLPMIFVELVNSPTEIEHRACAIENPVRDGQASGACLYLNHWVMVGICDVEIGSRYSSLVSLRILMES